MTDKRDLDEVREMITEALLSSIGPTSAMITSQYSTTATALIDAKREFDKVGWPEWIQAEVLVAMAGGSTTRRRS